LWIHYFSGRFRETVEQSRRTIDLEPAAGLPHAMLALAHADLGERAEAVRAAEVAARLAENSPTILVTTASAVAAADVDLGDTEQAFESLEQAYLQRSG
jgi:Flp pilus assembly protein TadD